MKRDEAESIWKKTGVIVKAFGWYTCPITFLENMGKNGAANYGYEYQTAGRPVNLVLDFDRSLTVIGAEALAKAEDLGHSAICQLLQELRAGISRLLGIYGLEIWVWDGCRFTGETTYKLSYHVNVPSLHARVIEDFAHLIRNIWLNGFLVEGKDAIDMDIFHGGRQLRLPGGAKHTANNLPEVPLGCITQNSFGPDNLLRKPRPDPDFEAARRSLTTVIDLDNSTLLDTSKLNMGLLIGTKSNPLGEKRKRDGDEQTSSEVSSAGPVRRRQKVTPPQPPQPSSDTAMVAAPSRYLHGNITEIAVILVRTHPRTGSVWDEWFTTLCVIKNETGTHPAAELLAIEYSRIREGYQGSADVEQHLRGLAPRGADESKVMIPTLAMLANKDRALVFATTENAKGLGPIGIGNANKWMPKIDQVLRWVDTEKTSGKWLIQVGAYLAPSAAVQMRAFVRQYYPQVNDTDFDTLWHIETRSEFYANALKDYVLKALEERVAPRVKRARTESDSGKGGAASKPTAALQGPKAGASSQEGKGDARDAGAKGKIKRAASKHRIVKPQP
jgi:hypothetical protein